MDDRLRDAAKQFAHHRGLELLRDTVESLLDNVAAESVHAQRHRVSTDSVSDSLNLVLRTMLKTTLNQEVSEAVDHQLVSLCDDGIHDCVLLLGRANLQLLLKED